MYKITLDDLIITNLEYDKWPPDICVCMCKVGSMSYYPYQASVPLSLLLYPVMTVKYLPLQQMAFQYDPSQRGLVSDHHHRLDKALDFYYNL